MKVIIAGSRNITSYEAVQTAFQEWPYEEVDMVVSGNAPGVDRLGERLAREWAVSLAIFPANWTRYKQSAGAMRNELMAEFADGLIAVWDGKSKGTGHMINTMQKLNKKVYIHIYEN